MANPNRLAGVTSFSINGVTYKVADDVTWMPANIKRESLKSLSGPTPGYSETFEPGMIGAKLYDAFDLSVTALMDMSNVTVQVEAANGKVVTGSGMWILDTPTVSGKEGSFEVKFEGPSVRDN